MWDESANNNQEEGILRTDAHMSFIETTRLRAFDVVHLLIFTGQLQKWIANRVKVKVVFSRVCFNRCQT